MDMRFADLIDTGMRQEVPMRLLILFVRVVRMRDPQHPERPASTLTPVMVTDKLIEPGLTFNALVEEADAINPAWDLVLISTLSRADGNIPASQEAVPHLQRMADTVVSGGDLSCFIVYDRAETPLRIESNLAGG